MSQHAILMDEPDERLLSLADWANLPEDEPGELVNGRLVEEEMPSFVHELIVGWLIEVLRRWAVPRGGFVFGSDAKYGLSPTRGRKPDVSIFLPGGQRPPAQGACRVAPDIMIEVVSPTPRDGRRDRVEKHNEYAAFGVRWYWLVDPALRTLEILELRPDGFYTHVVGQSEGVIDAVPGCEGLSIDLASLWAEVDRLSPEQDKPAEEAGD